MNTPSITRRLFLRNTASIGAVAAVGAGPAVAATLVVPDENPELLRLGEEFAAAMAEHEHAAEEHRAARARYQPPNVPDELVIIGNIGSGLGDYETDCEGRHLEPSRRLYSSAQILSFHEYVLTGFYRHGKPARPKHVRRMRAHYDAAVAYEEAKPAAIAACGVAEARQALESVRGRIKNLVLEMGQQTARTERGVTIKATAFNGCRLAGGGLVGFAMAVLSESFAADYVAVMAERAQS